MMTDKWDLFWESFLMVNIIPDRGCRLYSFKINKKAITTKGDGLKFSIFTLQCEISI